MHGGGLSLGLPQTWEDVPGSGQLELSLVGPSLTGQTLCGDIQHELILRHRPHCSVRRTPVENWIDAFTQPGERRRIVSVSGPHHLVKSRAKSGLGTTVCEDTLGSGQLSVLFANP